MIACGVVVLFIMASAVADDKPSDPIWPDTWQMEFHEDLYLPVLGTHHTSGLFTYDYPSGRYRIYREDGHYDRYCGLNGLKIFSSNKCAQYVSEGDRYLYYPDDDECCYCCSAEHGCGILKPDWMKGATFIDEESYQSLYGSGEAYKWDQKGLQDNFYYETIGKENNMRIMLEINQVPDDIQYFDPTTFTTKVDTSILDLPAKCSKKNACSWISTCHAVGEP